MSAQGKKLRYVHLELSPLGSCSSALVVIPAIRRIPPPLVLAPLLLLLLVIPLGATPLLRRTKRLNQAWQQWTNAKADVPQDQTGDELSDLSGSFAQVARALETREERSRRFADEISHDLATPLSVLQGHLSTLARATNHPSVRLAMNEVHYLGALCSSLKLTLQFDAGEIAQEDVDLGQVVTRVARRYRAFAERLGIEVEYSIPPLPVRFRGDVAFSEQALTNLVGNAVTHGSPGGHVAIVLIQNDDEFALKVLDDDPGLTENERQRVMARGQRGQATRSLDPHGRGLGLSIVARVAQAHDWNFSLTPNDPIGLTAKLTGPTLPKQSFEPEQISAQV